jgi:hypothetical protein
MAGTALRCPGHGLCIVCREAAFKSHRKSGAFRKHNHDVVVPAGVQRRRPYTGPDPDPDPDPDSPAPIANVGFVAGISRAPPADFGRELPIGPTCRLWTLSCRWGSATAVVQHLESGRPGCSA